jgi:pantoate kinase
MDGGPVRRAVATAPMHVTGFFSPALDARDPRGRGSIGAGIVLSVGVRARGLFQPRARRELRLISDAGRSLEISEEAARRMVGSRNGRISIELQHALPIGQGFGSSAAGAAASAMVVGRMLGRPRRAAIETAHLADLFGGGGLGGVSAILRGGLEIRVRPGIPPLGWIVHVPTSESLVVGTVGAPVPSPSVLTDRTLLDRIGGVSESVDRLRADPTLDEFFRLSESFTDRADLATPALRATLRSLRRRGAPAAQAMFGQSFFARTHREPIREEVVRWLRRRDIPFVELRPARFGVRSALVSRQAF